MNRLTENHFSFQCPMNWNDMEPAANGRFCNRCRKEVFDLTNCSLDEVRDLQQKHGSICGSIRVAQVAAVALSLSAVACEKKKPPTVGVIALHTTSPSQVDSEVNPDSAPLPDSPPQEVQPPIVLGKICVPKPENIPAPEDHPRVRGEIAPVPPAEAPVEK